MSTLEKNDVSPLNFLAQIEAIAEAADAQTHDSDRYGAARDAAVAEKHARMKAAEAVWRDSVQREVDVARSARKDEVNSAPYSAPHPSPRLLSRHERKQETAAREAVQQQRR